MLSSDFKKNNYFTNLRTTEVKIIHSYPTNRYYCDPIRYFLPERYCMVF